MTWRPSPVPALAVALLLSAVDAGAHSGPPFPILSDAIRGAYNISIWSDPDTTDDGKAAGQFWIVLAAADKKTTIPDGTRASVVIRPLDREGGVREGRASPVQGSVARQFVVLVMDHEGPFGVHVTVEGPLGPAVADTRVDATYDLRPAPALLALYVFPFVAVGALWMKALLRRRRHHS